MQMPIWRVRSVYGAEAEIYWAFVAVPDRAIARGFGDPYGNGEARISVAAVQQDGRIGTGMAQAVIKADSPRELDDEELSAIGWRVCETCGKYARQDAECACGA